MNSKECPRGTVHLGTTSKVPQWLAFVIHTFFSTNYTQEHFGTEFFIVINFLTTLNLLLLTPVFIHKMHLVLFICQAPCYWKDKNMSDIFSVEMSSLYS